MIEKRYAYIGPEDNFGLLNAISYNDARRHLGSRFKIKTVKLDLSLITECSYDRDLKRIIVKQAFEGINNKFLKSP